MKKEIDLLLEENEVYEIYQAVNNFLIAIIEGKIVIDWADGKRYVNIKGILNEIEVWSTVDTTDNYYFGIKKGYFFSFGDIYGIHTSVIAGAHIEEVDLSSASIILKIVKNVKRAKEVINRGLSRRPKKDPIQYMKSKRLENLFK